MEHRPPWLTPEGYVDLRKIPLDGTLREALSDSEHGVRDAIGTLRAMQLNGRTEAGVFLLGLLAAAPDDWHYRIQIVRALDGFANAGCTRFLFGELRRVRSSNVTRAYLGQVIGTLSGMPAELVRDGFEELASDPGFTPRMRAKFDAVLDQFEYRR